MSENKIKLPKGTIVPDHIALILDGNRRWARAKGLTPSEGHKAGYFAVRKVADASRNIGVHTFTVWCFSTENWSRNAKEIKAIMALVRYLVRDFRKNAMKDGVRFVHLGRKDRLPKDIAKLITELEKETKKKKKHVLNVALDYGGRDEMVRAVKKIVNDEVDENKIDEKLIGSYLDTGDQPYPNPDLFIRTSGEQRTSGLMPWQLSYAEYYFESDHLPDFSPDKLKEAILDFSRRRRRFGGNDAVKHLTFKPHVTAKLELAWWRLRKVPEGTRFRDFTIMYLREQYGLSKNLAKEAAIYMLEALREGDKRNWKKAKVPLKRFYRLLKDQLKLAFEPEIVTSLRIKLWQDIHGRSDLKGAMEVEQTARELLAEQYRISKYQASKAAHLRVLAKIERNLAEKNGGDYHWKKAEDYLEKYYKALKERVA